MNPPDGSAPADTATEAAALGITVAQLEARRVHDAKLRKDRENAPPDTLWGMTNPRNIITFPSSLPMGARQLVSLVLLVFYPLWLVLCLTVFVVGRCFMALGWLVFLPVRMHYKHKDPVGYEADKARLKKRKLNVFLEREPEDPEPSGTCAP